MLTLNDLREMKTIINLSALSRRAGISYNTIDSKLRNNTELTVIQSQQYMRALREFGLKFEGNIEKETQLFDKR